MSYQVALLNFEGPLDLLLQLIERSEMAVTEISLSTITEQYLSYTAQLDNLDPHELNQFIELAARLIYIKSRALLPLPPEESEPELAELEEQLAEYRHYQQAATRLVSLVSGGQRSWQRPAQPTHYDAPMPRNLDLDELSQIFRQAMARQTAAPTRVVTKLPSLQTVCLTIMNRVEESDYSLQALFNLAASRPETVLIFMAVLELIRSNQLAARQDQVFGDIMISKL